MLLQWSSVILLRNNKKEGLIYGIASVDFDTLMQEAADRGSRTAQIYLEKHVRVIS